uniref:C-type lectin domain-containing protein n=1 Tax=Mastacembelus armatus TaxID=205130 RepID=A0A3Q3LZU4_9TELE
MASVLQFVTLLLLCGPLLVNICAAGDCDCRPCPAGWSKTGPRCFRFFNTPDTWSNAEVITLNTCCSLLSGFYLNQCCVNYQFGDVQTAWIGGNDAVKGVWRWSDGSRFVNIAWATGEPNNLGTENFNGYNDLPCESKRPYVCGFTQ